MHVPGWHAATILILDFQQSAKTTLNNFIHSTVDAQMKGCIFDLTAVGIYVLCLNEARGLDMRGGEGGGGEGGEEGEELLTRNTLTRRLVELGFDLAKITFISAQTLINHRDIHPVIDYRNYLELFQLERCFSVEGERQISTSFKTRRDDQVPKRPTTPIIPPTQFQTLSTQIWNDIYSQYAQLHQEGNWDGLHYEWGREIGGDGVGKRRGKGGKGGGGFGINSESIVLPNPKKWPPPTFGPKWSIPIHALGKLQLNHIISVTKNSSLDPKIKSMVVRERRWR